VIIRLEEIKIEEKKIKIVLSLSASKEVKDIQKFLELANYCWQIIKNFIKITRPLYELVRNKQK